VFQTGPLAAKRVSIKAYGRHEDMLDISPHPGEHDLVLADPPASSKCRPWTIEQVFLLETRVL
jgi:hypothetical protein